MPRGLGLADTPSGGGRMPSMPSQPVEPVSVRELPNIDNELVDTFSQWFGPEEAQKRAAFAAAFDAEMSNLEFGEGEDGVPQAHSDARAFRQLWDAFSQRHDEFGLTAAQAEDTIQIMLGLYD